MDDRERSLYESAIRAKEAAIRELLRENRRLRRQVAELVQGVMPELQGEPVEVLGVSRN